MTRRTGLALALATAAISGVSVYVNADGVRHFGDPTVYTTAKNLVAALLLVALALVTRPLPAESGALSIGYRRFPRRVRVGLVAVGLVGGAVPFVLFFEGLARASSPSAAFVHKTLVVWVALLAIPLLKERLTWVHAGAIGLLVVGQATMVDGLHRLRPGDGETMVLAATLLWAVEVVLAKRLLAAVPSAIVGAARMGIGVVALLAWLVVTGRLGDLLGLSPSQWGWALVTGALLAGYVTTWFAALARAPAIDVTAVLVLAAPVTAALDASLRGASLAPHLLGLALVVAGGALVFAPRPAPAPVRVRR